MQFFGHRDETGENASASWPFSTRDESDFDYIHSLGLKAGILSGCRRQVIPRIHLRQRRKRRLPDYTAMNRIWFISPKEVRNHDFHQDRLLLWWTRTGGWWNKKCYSTICQAIKQYRKNGWSINICRQFFLHSKVKRLARSWRNVLSTVLYGIQ